MVVWTASRGEVWRGLVLKVWGKKTRISSKMVQKVSILWRCPSDGNIEGLEPTILGQLAYSTVPTTWRDSSGRVDVAAVEQTHMGIGC